MSDGVDVGPDAGMSLGVARPCRRRLLLLLPFAGFMAASVRFCFLTWRNPHLVPSPLIGKPVPVFNLSPVQERTLGLSSADLRGQVPLVNAFASWCVACRAEHPVLMRLKATGAVPVHGLNYKDAPKDAAPWLDRMGDPYIRTGADRDGRVAIDWGLYGVPETFVVDGEGHVAYKQIGALTPEIVDTVIMPLVRRLRAAMPGRTP